MSINDQMWQQQASPVGSTVYFIHSSSWRQPLVVLVTSVPMTWEPAPLAAACRTSAIIKTALLRSVGRQAAQLYSLS